MRKIILSFNLVLLLYDYLNYVQQIVIFCFNLHTYCCNLLKLNVFQNFKPNQLHNKRNTIWLFSFRVFLALIVKDLNKFKIVIWNIKKVSFVKVVVNVLTLSNKCESWFWSNYKDKVELEQFQQNGWPAQGWLCRGKLAKVF